MSFGQVGNGCLTVEHTHTDCSYKLLNTFFLVCFEVGKRI